MKIKSKGLFLVALLISLFANLILINIGRNYFSLLNPVAVLGSRVDGRGGLWEVNWLVPCLVVTAMIGGLIAAENKKLKRLAHGLIFSSVVVGSLCFGLYYLIRDLLK